MRSILAIFFEWLLSRSSERFKLFRTARLKHEEYMRVHDINIEAITPAQRRQAKTSSELCEAESLYRKSLAITESEGAFKNVAIVHQQLGLLYFMRGELELSKDEYSKSLSMLENQPQIRAGDLDAISTCQLFLGLIALENGNYVVAREQFLKAKEIDQRLNNPWSLQMDNRLLARCNQEHGK